jgi:hypothetical protein
LSGEKRQEITAPRLHLVLMVMRQHVSEGRDLLLHESRVEEHCVHVPFAWKSIGCPREAPLADVEGVPEAS